MSIQIAVRLPDEVVAAVDEIVGRGGAGSRTELVTVAIQRELRRRAAERDAEILAEQGAEDDLDDLVRWTAANLRSMADDA
ncbi:ribbon-helix-helix domain-containing protein [Salana multivorans]